MRPQIGRQKMNCHEAASLIYAYLDGELELTSHVNVEEHLRDCPTCSSIVQRQRRIDSAMKAPPLYSEAPPELERRVRIALRGASARHSLGRRIAWRPLSVAAGLVLVA